MSDGPDYLDDLILELRLLDVPGERIGQILAESESHLAESGEAPEVAFGPVRTYARELALRQATASAGGQESTNVVGRLFAGMSVREWVLAGASFVATALAAAVLLNGVLALLGATPFLGLPPWVLIVVGAVLLGAFGLGVWRLADPIIDPRSGDRVDFTRRGHRKVPGQ